MKNTNRNISLFAKSITPINFCGKPVAWQMDCKIYEPPYETIPTTGEHNFNKCEGCQKNLQQLREELQSLFNGTKEKTGFPLCCEYHIELAKFPTFNRNDFVQVPDWTAKKIIYTRQHIINNILSENYYEEITNYIDYTIDSFGQTPNNSEPLFLDYYWDCIFKLIPGIKNVPKIRKEKLIEYLNSFKIVTKREAKTDFNILISTYEKWFKIFPWQMCFFSHLKPQFEKMPIIQSVAQVNKYSGKAIAKPHTKSSLIEMLLNITNSIITQINSLVLYENGELTNPQKVRLDLITNERRLKIQQGYTNNSQDEGQRYRNILKEWFNDEKKFIDEITPLLSTSESVNTFPISNGYKIDEFLNYFSGKCSQKFREQLIKDMETILLSNLNGRQITAIASVIYNSDKLHTATKPKTFNKWIEVFSKCWNVPKPKSKQSAVKKEITDAKSTFYYVADNFTAITK